MQVAKLNIDDFSNMLARQRVKHDEIIDTVDEFGSEMAADNFHDSVFHRFIVFFAGHLLDQLRAEV